GRSVNAVKTQVWIAISVYVLVALIKKRLNLETSLYTFLQILSITTFEKLPILQVLREFYDTGCPVDPSKQLELFKL
ncbi:MAG: IS4 family transposase, partial [Candidatus Aminicenantaceae bacterium]